MAKKEYRALEVDELDPENKKRAALNESDHDPFKRRADDIKCHCMRSTLLVQFPGDELLSVDPKCAIVLTSLSEKHWDGRWRLSAEESEELLDKIEGKNTIKNSKLSLAEIERFVDTIDKKEISHMPGAVRGLMNRNHLREVYKEMDPNGDDIDYTEWQRFLTMCAALRFQHLHGLSFVNGRCYWGRGQHYESGRCPRVPKDGHQRSMLLDALSREGIYDEGKRFFFCNQLLAIGPDNLTGWNNDLYYFSANNHALHGIIACDPTHRLARHERLAMEITTVFFTILVTNGGQVGRIAPWTNSIEDPFLYKLVVITIPGTLLWYVLFYLYTTPKCGQADESEDSKTAIHNAKLCSAIGDLLGILISLIITGFCVYEFVKPDRPGVELWKKVLYSRGYGYIIQWVTMIFVNFNPIISVGMADPSKQGILSTIGGAMGLGRWSVEKRRFQLLCKKASGMDKSFSTGGSTESLEPSKFWLSGSSFGGGQDDLKRTFKKVYTEET